MKEFQIYSNYFSHSFSPFLACSPLSCPQSAPHFSHFILIASKVIIPELIKSLQQSVGFTLKTNFNFGLMSSGGIYPNCLIGRPVDRIKSRNHPHSSQSAWMLAIPKAEIQCLSDSLCHQLENVQLQNHRHITPSNDSDVQFRAIYNAGYHAVHPMECTNKFSCLVFSPCENGKKVSAVAVV